MTFIKNLKARMKIEAELTPTFAHELLAKMPVGDFSLYYGARTKKFFRSNEHGGTIAWSETLQKWIMWLHPTDPLEVTWSFNKIRQVASQYQYQINDRVLYCGITNLDESCVYTVVGRDTQDRVMLNDGEREYGSFYMNAWRLATKEEVSLNQRILVTNPYSN